VSRESWPAGARHASLVPPSEIPAKVPTETDARRILETLAGASVRSLARFPTGLAHYVYDAVTVDGERYVVRLTRKEKQNEFAGAVYWHGLLRPCGVPLAQILYSDVAGEQFGFPVLLLERLPGTDLCHVYASLNDAEKRTLAGEVAAVQQRVALLPAGRGFGYACSYDDPSLYATWTDVLHESLARSRRQIRAAGVIDSTVVDRVEGLLTKKESYLSEVAPICFLHDMQAKNVIIDRGRLSGIVDIDSICFGDPLYTLALTRMALLSDGQDTRYIDAWANALGLTHEHRSILTLYTAICCVDFMSEYGQRFNQESAALVREEDVMRLGDILDELLTRFAEG
jgi:Ser/Thr protein kinase RdoA (MazF antagonist)